MRKTHLLMITAISVAVFAVAASDMAQGSLSRCTVHDRIELHQAGYDKAEVLDMCGPNATQIPSAQTSSAHPWSILGGEGQPRWVQWCITPQGRCSLNPATSGYYEAGAPCNCYMPWGFYVGVAE